MTTTTNKRSRDAATGHRPEILELTIKLLGPLVTKIVAIKIFWSNQKKKKYTGMDVPWMRAKCYDTFKNSFLNTLQVRHKFISIDHHIKTVLQEDTNEELFYRIKFNYRTLQPIVLEMS